MQSIDKDDIKPREWISDPKEFEELDAALGNLCKHVAQKLCRKYGIEWRWVIQPDPVGGIITVYASKLSMSYGFNLLTKVVQEDANLDCITRAGGEILERFGLPRGKFKPEYMARLVYGLDMSPKPDMLDKSSGLLHKHRDQELTKAMQDGTALLETKDETHEDGSVTRHVALGVKGAEE